MKPLVKTPILVSKLRKIGHQIGHQTGQITLLATLLILCTQATGCGNKGNLYHPASTLPEAEAPIPPKAAEQKEKKVAPQNEQEPSLI